MKNRITTYFIAVGIIIFIIGVYSMFFLAGLPYPDPTPEMTRRWMLYYNLGKVTIPSGVILVVIGTAFKILIKLNKK